MPCVLSSPCRPAAPALPTRSLWDVLPEHARARLADALERFQAGLVLFSSYQSLTVIPATESNFLSSRPWWPLPRDCPPCRPRPADQQVQNAVSLGLSLFHRERGQVCSLGHVA